MPRKRFRIAEIIKKLREAEVLCLRAVTDWIAVTDCMAVTDKDIVKRDSALGEPGSNSKCVHFL